MTNRRIRLGVAAILILIIGQGVLLHTPSEHSDPAKVFAVGIAVFDNPPTMIFTCNEDGTTLYRWQCDPKVPLKESKYLGKTEAILSE